MFDIQLVCNYIDNYAGGKFAGLYSYFIPMGEWGIKFYARQSERDECFNNQVRLYELGLAPKPLICFEYKRGSFCYITEKAEPFMPAESGSGMTYDEYSDNWDEAEEMYGEELDRFVEFVKEKCGIYFGDVHLANFGLLRGKIVCIDMGCV